MKQFPDESQMARSQDGSEPVRGGSIGLNRILNTLVAASGMDRRPRFTGVFLNAFTIFRNVWSGTDKPSMQTLEEGFVTDLNLFLEYFDTYLAHVWNHQLNSRKYVPVVVYFPDYARLPKELEKERTGKRGELEDLYDKFLARHQHETGLVRTLDHIQCFFVPVGPNTYPHRELEQKFRDITHRRDTLYTRGDPVAITTHIPLDLYLMYRMRNLHLLESNTGKIHPASEFHRKLDKDGRVPLQGPVHAVVGDDKMIKHIVSSKLRREVLTQAEAEKWSTRDKNDVIVRLSKLVDIPIAKLRTYEFD